MRAWAPGMQAPIARAVSIQYYYPRPTASEPKPNTRTEFLPRSRPDPALNFGPSLVSPTATYARFASSRHLRPHDTDRRPNRARSSSTGDYPPADSSVRLGPGSSALVPTERKNRHTTLLSGHICAKVCLDSPLRSNKRLNCSPCSPWDETSNRQHRPQSSLYLHSGASASALKPKESPDSGSVTSRPTRSPPRTRRARVTRPRLPPRTASEVPSHRESSVLGKILSCVESLHDTSSYAWPDFAEGSGAFGCFVCIRRLAGIDENRVCLPKSWRSASSIAAPDVTEQRLRLRHSDGHVRAAVPPRNP